MDTTLSHAAGPTDRPLLDMTIGENFDHAVARFPNREALVEVATGRRWTYTELRADVDAVAQALLEDGIIPGDRVGIWAPNCAEWAIVQFATAKIGAILVTLNSAYRSHELEYVLTQSGIRLLFALSSFKSSDYAAMVAEVAPHCRALETVVYLDDEQWGALLRRGSQITPNQLAEATTGLTPEDAINIQYTSGTTGFTKGVTLSHRNISTTGTSWASCSATPNTTESACRCRSTTVSAWSWATSVRSHTAHASSSRPRYSIRSPPFAPAPRNAAPPCTACPLCSSASSTSPMSTPTTCPRSAPEPWPAPRARWK